MKILTVVGARPQFIKAAILSKELRKYHDEIILHTGQHFDSNMSDVFFEELEIPIPKYNLNINGGTHAQMTGRMLMSIEDVLFKEHPNAILVYGDTNSTMAAAIAGVKLNIPIIHVEALVRTGVMSSPEEVNRIITDKLSTLLFACTNQARIHAEREGLTKNLYVVGDLMYDAFLYYRFKKPFKDVELKSFEDEVIKPPSVYNLLTIHRQENTMNINDIQEILKAMVKLKLPVIYPVHPRNRKTIKTLRNDIRNKNILFVNPVGYLDSLSLIINANKIVTDSGGVKREAFFAKKPCVTVLDTVSWPEIMINNCNQLANPVAEDIVDKFKNTPIFDDNYRPFGDGRSALKICDVINNFTF